MADISNIPKQSYFRAVLQSPITSAQTSNIVLSDVPEYSTSGETVYLNILDPDSPETISVTGWNGTTNVLSGVTRGVAKYTGGGSTAAAHGAGIPVVLSNDWNYFNDYATAINAKVDTSGDTMTGLLQFSGLSTEGLRVKSLTTTERDALTPSNGALIYNTTTGEFNVYQGGAWSVVASGSTQPDASTTVAGKVELATQSELNAGTPTGGTGASLVPTPATLAVLNQNNPQTYATSSGSSNAYVLTLTPAPTAYAAGQRFSFKANFGNTGSATLNVNSLGAKTLKVPNGNTLISGDIATNQIVTAVYDGTDMIITSPITNKFLYTGSLTPATNDILYYNGTSFVNDTFQNYKAYTLGRAYWDNMRDMTATGTGTHGEAFFLPVYITASSAGARSASSLKKEIGAASSTSVKLPANEFNAYAKYAQNGANAAALGFCIGIHADTTYTFADIVNGSAVSNGAVFVYINGTLQTVTSDGSGTESNTIGGITVTNYNLYRILWNGTDVKFYINGSLVATHTTETLEGGASHVGFGVNAATASRTADFYVAGLSFISSLS